MTPRPYPAPRKPWVMAMDWHDLLFMHWPVAPESLRSLVPASLHIDTHAGQAWVGVIPFRMRRVRGRFLPPVPPLGAFLELNVRTYVTKDGLPGVWFFSLDAQSRLAVEAARLVYGLRYLRAQMSCERDGEWLHYRSERADRRGAAAALDVRYRPDGPPFHPQPGTFAAFLVDRYCLYAARNATVRRAEIDHPPWPLQPARLELVRSTMGGELGLTFSSQPDGVFFARQLSVVAWLPE